MFEMTQFSARKKERTGLKIFVVERLIEIYEYIILIQKLFFNNSNIF